MYAPASSRRSSSLRPSPSQADLSGLRRSMTREFRKKRRRKETLVRRIAAVLLVLMVVPVAAAFAGASREAEGCTLVHGVDGDTVQLSCPGTGTQPHDVMGLSSPPLMGASCLAEAWWGLRARVALRARLWQASQVRFVTEPRARLTVIYLDDRPVHRVITPVPAHLCA